MGREKNNRPEKNLNFRNLEGPFASVTCPNDIQKSETRKKELDGHQGRMRETPNHRINDEKNYHLLLTSKRCRGEPKLMEGGYVKKELLGRRARVGITREAPITWKKDQLKKKTSSGVRGS